MVALRFEGAEPDSQRLTPVLFANCLIIGVAFQLKGLFDRELFKSARQAFTEDLESFDN